MEEALDKLNSGIEENQEDKSSNLTTPEGVSMMLIAGILDLIGIVCLLLDIFFGVGEIISWISDGIGIIFISGWMFFRTGRIVAPDRLKDQKGPLQFLRKIFRGKWKRFLTPVIGEVTPFAGALPFWTLAVYFELTS